MENYMKHSTWIIFLIVPLVMISCRKKSDAPTANDSDKLKSIVDSPYVPDGYQIGFSEEFNTFELDVDGDGSSTWAPWFVGWDVRFLGGNEDKAWKCDASYVGGGKEALGLTLHERTDSSTLRLYGLETPKDKLDNVEQFPYIGGMISSNQSMAQLYGYFEIKCRFEITKGHHWAVWLLPIANKWPPEIDIVEAVGHQPYYAFCNAHGSSEKDTFTIRNVESVFDYHIYGFEWTPTEMIYTLDGEEHLRVPNYINEPMYFLVSPEIGGQWTKLPDETTVWPMVCEIEYIRIYDKIPGE